MANKYISQLLLASFCGMCGLSAAAIAQDPDVSNPFQESDPDHSSEGVFGSGALLNGIPGSNGACETIGGFAVSFQFSNRYRGNLYRINQTGYAVREIKMALAFSGAADLFISVHRKEVDGTYTQVDINTDPSLDHVLIAGAMGAGDNNVQYYSTGPIGGPGGVPLPPGDYAIGFAWGAESVKYGRDSGVSYPSSFPVVSILGSVSRELAAGEPPMPPSVSTLTLFTGGAYAMELCFEPTPPDPCICPSPPGPCFAAGDCDVTTGVCVYAQLADGAACSVDPPDATCSFYTCDANAACIRQCDENCFPFGGFASTFTFPNRYRGNLYHISDGAVSLREIGMEFAFAGTTSLYVSVHRMEDGGSFTQVDINSDPLLDYVVIADAQGAGINSPRFYSTGAIGGAGGVPLPPGDYAIGFAWGAESVKYGRDSGISYPRPFEFGSIAGSVSRELQAGEPPIPGSLPSLTLFTAAAYAMELCFEQESVAVPIVSEWGLVTMALLGLTAGTILFSRRKRQLVTAPISPRQG